jgi:hypothetical protein
MSDLFHVRVESQDARSVRLRLQILHRDEITFPLSPGFAMMLLGDESIASHADFRRWERARADEDEWFSSGDHIESVRLLEVRGLPREQGSPPDGLTWDEVDESEDRGLLGEALYEITVDIDGMLSHLAPGTTWESTAYDEAGEGPFYLGQSDDVRAWTRAG